MGSLWVFLKRRVMEAERGGTSTSGKHKCGKTREVVVEVAGSGINRGKKEGGEIVERRKKEIWKEWVD